MLKKRFSSLLSYHHFSLEYITSKQQTAIKSSIVNAKSYLNRIFPPLNFLNIEFYPENRLTDSFSSCFSFYKTDCSLEESKSHHCSHLDSIMLNASYDSSTVIIISDASIKNNIITIKAELFAIRCGINLAIQIPGTSHIIIITDTLYII